jgi:hypothetical protein
MRAGTHHLDDVRVVDAREQLAFDLELVHRDGAVDFVGLQHLDDHGLVLPRRRENVAVAAFGQECHVGEFLQVDLAVDVAPDLQVADLEAEGAA